MKRLALLSVLVACQAEERVVALEFTADAACTAERLGALASVSVEVHGDAAGELCTLARRCVTVDGLAALPDLVAALRDATQPLVDISLEGTRRVAVLGHDRLGCGEGDRALCGFADLADADGDVLTVPLSCEPDDCPLEVPPFCP
jgi:hypothetical protein